jgi:hypothetical protein
MSGDEVLTAVEAALVARFGDGPARASVSFVGVERVEVLRWRDGGMAQLATLGASRHPMHSPDSMHVDPVRGPRVELLTRIRDGSGPSSDAVVRSLAILAASPSVEGIVLRSGATMDLGTPIAPGSSCTGFILAGPILDADRTEDSADAEGAAPADALPAPDAQATGEASAPTVTSAPGSLLDSLSGVADLHLGTLDMSAFEADVTSADGLDLESEDVVVTGVHGVDPVVLLQAIPVTGAELAWARARGVPALQERFLISGTDLSDLGRQAVTFEGPV